MPYATSDDLVAAFGDQLKLVADRDGDGVLDADVVAKALADASAIVDLHVRGIYAVPLSPIDPEIVGITCDLARTKIYSNVTQVPDSVTDADKAARAMLLQIARGDFKLTAAVASGTATSPDALDVLTSGDAPIFDSETLKGF